MLLPADRAALRGGRFLPAQSNAIASGLSCRGVTLARTTYATYDITNTTGGTATIMTMQFDPYTFSVGDQIRVSVLGSAINNTGAPVSVGAQVNIIQGGVTQPLGFRATAPSFGSTPYAWKSDILIAVSNPAFDGQSAPSFSKNTVPQTLSPPAATSDSIAFTGGGTTIIGDNSLTTSQARGFLSNNPTTSGSTVSATFGQAIFTNSDYITINVVILGTNLTAPNGTTVQAGVVECL